MATPRITAAGIIGAARRHGLTLRHGWYYHRQGRWATAAGAIAIDRQPSLADLDRIGREEIATATGLSEEAIDGLTEGFEGTPTGLLWRTPGYVRYYKIGRAVGLQAGLLEPTSRPDAEGRDTA